MGRMAEVWQEQQDREFELNQGGDMPEIIRVEGFILKTSWGTYTHAPIEMTQAGYITICPHVLEFAIPEGFNPVAAEVAMLEKKLDEMADEHMQKVRQVKERIANLQSIEYKPAQQTESFIDDELPF